MTETTEQIGQSVLDRLLASEAENRRLVEELSQSRATTLLDAADHARTFTRKLDEAGLDGDTSTLMVLADRFEELAGESTFFCKGDWVLGTACGRCPRCLSKAPDYINMLHHTLNSRDK